MVKVEIVPGVDSYEGHIQIDGEIFKETMVRKLAQGSIVRANVRDPAVSAKLQQASFSNLTSIFSDLGLRSNFVADVMFPSITLVTTDREDRPFAAIAVGLRPNLSKWSKPWSFQQYVNAFDIELERIDEQRILKSDQRFLRPSMMAGGKVYVMTDFDFEIPLIEALKEVNGILACVHDATEKHLTTNLNRGSLVTFFDFPPTVKVACEQYLQYFIQFLDDLGIEADSELTSTAGKVLFSVTPRSDEEALEAIQGALAAYLELPKGDAAGGFDPIHPS